MSSRTEEILKDIIDESGEIQEPQSRIEKQLVSILKNEPYEDELQSRIEILIELVREHFSSSLEAEETLKSLIDRSITSIEFPDGITSIGDYAFAGCVDLNITIPDNLEIGDNAFFNCNNVNIITDTKPQYELDANSKFYGCNNLTIIVPEGTTTIAEEAFKDCEVITELVTPNSLTEIRPMAFMDCSRLKKATIVSNSASEFKFMNGVFSQCHNLETVELPSITKVINAYTFYNNYNLKNINMPSSLVQIRVGAFVRCNSLTTITLPSGVQYLGREAFYNCRGLKTISIPNSIKEIGDIVFALCSSLENVVLESGFNANGLDLSASTLYSVNTLVTMLNALSDRTGLEAYTLVLGGANLAKLSNEQIAIAVQKNWTLA